MEKTVKGYVLLDQKNDRTLQEFQNGPSFYYEPMIKFFLKKRDALMEADGENLVVKATITYTV